LVKDILKEFGTREGKEQAHSLEPVVIDDHNTDWDAIYPFSAVRPFAFQGTRC